MMTTTSSSNYNAQSVGGYNITGQERVESTRQVSSTIVREEYMGVLPQQEEIRYVEVPCVEEVIKTIPRKEVVEVEKRVPKYEYEWVERVVEIPQIQYVDKQIDVPQIQEIIRTVPKVQVVDVPKEVIRHVPKIEYKQVEKIVEVPGQVIEVPKPYKVENPIQINRYQDREVAMVVAQSIKPFLTETNDYLDVDVMAYEPECVPVDVHVLKPVSAQIIAAGATETIHRLVSVPAAQYNTMLKTLNVHLGEMEIQKLPYMTVEGGRTPFITDGTKVMGSAPIPDAIVLDQFGSRINATRWEQRKMTVAPGQQTAMSSQSMMMQQTSGKMIQSGTMVGQPGLMARGMMAAGGVLSGAGATNVGGALTSGGVSMATRDIMQSGTFMPTSSYMAPPSQMSQYQQPMQMSVSATSAPKFGATSSFQQTYSSSMQPMISAKY